jgi:hypothetical protein
VAKVGTSKAGGTKSQQAVVHPWLAADAQGKKTNQQTAGQQTTFVLSSCLFFSPSYPLYKDMTTDKNSFLTRQPKVQNMVKRKKN